MTDARIERMAETYARAYLAAADGVDFAASRMHLAHLAGLQAIADMDPDPLPDWVREIDLTRIDDADGGGWYAQVETPDGYWAEGEDRHSPIAAVMQAIEAGTEGGR